MRNLIIFCLLTLTIACGEAKKSNDIVSIPMTPAGKIDTAALPKFAFTSDNFDFGKITQGEIVKCSFVFTNEGKSPLVISSASASCGCTVPSYSEDPIAPGAQGKIEVVFDSKGKLGMQTKTITLIANTIPNTKVLYLRGEITNE
jgi:hypothetical protein